MKALKCALAISLALNLVLAVVLWRNAGANRAEESAMAAASEEAAVEAVVDQKSWSDMHAPRPIMSSGLERASLPSRRERMEEAPSLPPNPYAVPAWDERMPSSKGKVDKGLYVVPRVSNENKE